MYFVENEVLYESTIPTVSTFLLLQDFDPVSTASGNSDVDLGIDFNAFPISRSFSVGFNLTF